MPGSPSATWSPARPDYASTANDGCLSQDIEGANRLLDDSEVLDTDGDGIREYNGVPLKITYQTSTNSIRQDTQALIRDWWRQIGIEIELVHTTPASFSMATRWLTHGNLIAGSSPTCKCMPTVLKSTPSNTCRTESANILIPRTTTGPPETMPAPATRSTTSFSFNLPKPGPGLNAPRWSNV